MAKHSLFIIVDTASDLRVGSIKAVSATSALEGFRKGVPVDRREGLSARVAAEGERP